MTIVYQEFCRRGQKQQSGVACAGRPGTGLVWIVAGRLIRLPASLLGKGVRISHHGPQ